MKSVLFKVVASILLSCMCLTQTVTAQEMPIFEVQGTLSPVQKAFLSNAFKRAYSLLPLEMRKRLQKNSSFQSYKILPVVMDSHSVGEVQQGGKISINLNLLNTQNSELLNRTLIHELSHVYDLLPWQPQNLQVALMICSSWHDRSPPDYCEAYKRVETSVSTMPSFLDITGWYQKFGGKGERIKETTFINRSPDPYEKTNPKEMFAVNMEYFLTDPEYKCRRPSLYNYLSNHFMEEPFKDYNCQQNLTFIDPQFMDVNKAVRKIDPDRVYQIHYLYADAGDGLVSAFGHSMVRIVMCAPERKTVGPECIKDISNHIILSFRGFVDTPEFSGLNGLLGGYASNLFFLPLPQIIDEYTVQQFRNLYSYPVALTKEKIKAFLARAVETYWSYKNNYYFLTNNCATETMNLFRTSLGFKEHLEAAHVQTPIEVLQALQLNHLISHEVEFNDLSAAKEKGYFFPSIEKDLNLALDTLHKISVQVSNESM
ncbi:MAG: DUF7844 domain-containing protein, partial [Parachlamydiaceae bacterium]